jgi:APA family basic amino acid/polyamine antiporter
MGELLAWTVGWALVLEYAVAASAVSVGWSGYIVGLFRDSLGITIPQALSAGPYAGGIVNLPAMFIALMVTWLLMIGTTESARVNAVLVAIKVAALSLFVIITLPLIKGGHFTPFTPNGWGIIGVGGAAASIFFAYVGFDAVSTAAEETKNPQRNVPIGLIGSLVICTIFYLLVAAGAIGAIGAQPVQDAAGHFLSPGTPEIAGRCAALLRDGVQPLVCSDHALVHVLQSIEWPVLGRLVGLAAVLALPSVVLMMMFGQTRIFFVMARDGLLPEKLASVHPRFKTPHVVTMITGVAVALAAAILPVGKLADYSNSGTLFAFMMVAIAVLVLRRTDPGRRRPFRTPAIWLVAPLAILGCVALYFSLPLTAILILPIWAVIGLLLYFGYSRSRSHVGRGIVEVHELDPDAPPGAVASMPGAPAPGTPEERG